MCKKISVILAIFLAVVFSTQSFAAKPLPPITIAALAGDWPVTVGELLIVGGLGVKKATNPATVTFVSDVDLGDSFSLTNDSGILGFSADCSVAKKGAKIAWNIMANYIELFESNLEAAISVWAADNSKTIVLDSLEVRSYAYKPIVVKKNNASLKFGILQVKGTVAINGVDEDGLPVIETKNFKYQCKFKFSTNGSDDSGDAIDEGDLAD